jgi:hypothetical protein
MQKSSRLGTIRALILGRGNSARINRDNEGILPLRYLTIFGVAFVAILTACEPAKPSGNEYLGQWNESGQFCHCALNITKNGSSFVVKSNVSISHASCDICRMDDILTLSPEGNLVSGGRVVMSFDKTKNQIIMPGYGEDSNLSKQP